MAKKKGSKKAHEQLVVDRQVLQTVGWYGDDGWEIIGEAAAEFGLDPLRLVLGAIARELVRTSVRYEQQTEPVVALLSHAVTGRMPDEVAAVFASRED